MLARCVAHVFSRVRLSYDREQHIMGLDPDATDFALGSSPISARPRCRDRHRLPADDPRGRRRRRRAAKARCQPTTSFPKGVDVLAVSATCARPYSGAPGRRVELGVYRVTVRLRRRGTSASRYPATHDARAEPARFSPCCAASWRCRLRAPSGEDLRLGRIRTSCRRSAPRRSSFRTQPDSAALRPHPEAVIRRTTR